MSTYRRTAMAVITCVAGLSLTACSVGITTARTGTSPSVIASHTGSSPTAGPSHSAPPSQSASPRPSPVPTASLNAAIPSFPIPPGSSVVYNLSCLKQISVMVNPVTPSQSSAFYTTALPRAGYKIVDTLATDGLDEIDISGHGYTGSIATITDVSAEPSSGPSLGTLPSNMTKNVEQIVMTANGTSNSYICPAT